MLDDPVSSRKAHGLPWGPFRLRGNVAIPGLTDFVFRAVSSGCPRRASRHCQL